MDKTINKELAIKDIDLEFAQELIKKPVAKKADYLMDKLLSDEQLGIERKFELQQIIEKLRGSNISGN